MASPPPSTRDPRAALEAGMRHHKSGNLRQAESLYRQVLAVQPGNPDALYLFGMLALDAGRPADAATQIAKAIKRRRKVPHYHVALGDAYRAQGKPREAAACYRKALALDPKSTAAHFNLATVRHAENKLADAIVHYRRAIAIAPDLAEAHNNLGVALTDEGRRKEAGEHFRRAVALRPDYADAYLNLGQALRTEGHLDEAIAAYEKALELDPRLVEAHNNLGNALRDAGRPEAAVERYERALAIRPDYAEAHNNLGVALGDLGHTEEAVAAHRRALELQPDWTDAHAGLGAALQVLGRIEEAIAHYERALDLDPDHARAHHNLAMAREADSAEEEIARLERRLGDAALTEKDATTLRFALGKLCDDTARFDDAFAHYAAANALKRTELARQGLSFDAALHERLVDRLIAAFDRTVFAGRSHLGDPSDVPVFIVGMPRSGTTLVEQILASHSCVFGAGELEHVGHLVTSLAAEIGSGAPYPECVGALDPATAGRLGRTYVEQLRANAPDAARITDKLPGNFLHLGAIALLLPGARVVHCRRDAFDTCLSCYFQSFNRTLAYAYDLNELGGYYRQYARLMAHWREVLPLPLLELDYEELIENQEEVSRRLVDFCSLDWETACLAFHETERAVQTASLSQVRRPIYRSSLARWRNYEAHLAPLRAALGR